MQAYLYNGPPRNEASFLLRVFSVRRTPESATIYVFNDFVTSNMPICMIFALFHPVNFST